MAMRLGRFRTDNTDRIGVFDSGMIRDISENFDTFRDVLANPDAAAAADGDLLAEEDVTYLPPTTETNSIFCAGLNYEAHAEESDIAIPDSPLVFMKLPQTLVGHRESISYHTQVTDEIDYEAELAAVIGTPGRDIAAENALDHVAGYTVFNDTSARDLQFGLQVGDDDVLDWFSGKAMSKTTPVGPHVVVDEIEDPQDLTIESRVNGETLQDDTTGMMVRSVADLVSFVSSRVEISPGDVIATGTPEGVGTFQDIRLEHGDTVEVDVEEIGTLTNTVRDVTKSPHPE